MVTLLKNVIAAIDQFDKVVDAHRTHRVRDGIREAADVSVVGPSRCYEVLPDRDRLGKRSNCHEMQSDNGDD
jgi:hypothetical protein